MIKQPFQEMLREDHAERYHRKENINPSISYEIVSTNKSSR